MKTYEEMAQSVLTRIEEYEIEKRSKRQRLRKAALVSVPVCVAVIAAAGAFRSGVVGNSNKVPVADTEKSIVSSVSEKESRAVSSAVNAQAESSDKTSDVIRSESKSSSSRDDTKKKAESAIVNGDPYYENSGENISTSEENVLSSAADSTPNHESNNDTESSQNISTANDDEDTAPERGFGYVDDTLGMIYKDGVMYMQFSVYDDGFTLDEYIGAASDFDGTYKYIEDVTGEVYTVKESPDVLIVKLSNGGTVALAKAGQLIVNGTPYCSTMLDTFFYPADRFIGRVSDFEIVNVPYLHYDIELSPNDEVYTVADKDVETLCIKQENGNVVIFVSMW